VDVAILAILLTAFGLLVTTHLTLAILLLFRVPWWRGLIALVIPPLAPYWSYESGLKIGAALWVLAVFLYAVALIAALSI
jgi:hypothetical protein